MIRMTSILCLVVLCVSKAYSQEIEKYSGSYNDWRYIDIVEDLESRYRLRFLGDSSVDGLMLSMSFDQVPIEDLIQLFEKNTGRYFFVKNQTDIICTQQYKIMGDLRVLTSSSLETEDTFNLETESDELFRPFIDAADEIIQIGKISRRFEGESAILSGRVTSNNDGEPIVGASVFIKQPFVQGTVTDSNGDFVLELKKGKTELYVTSTGMEEVSMHIDMLSDGVLNIWMHESVFLLDEIVVSDSRDLIENVGTGLNTISREEIKKLPTLLGESDILQLALSLPGVQTTGEGASGFNVRGSSADQNLVLLNGVPLYNTNHLFGIFSVFNSDVISKADLYKSGIPADFGGRGSSVFDVSTKVGNTDSFDLRGGFSPVAARLTIEGPISKNESSYILGLRSTYSDWIFSLLDGTDLNDASANFQDIIANVTLKPGKNSKLSLSGYHSNDVFHISSDTLNEYSNTNISLEWKKLISSGFSTQLRLSWAKYDFGIEETGLNASAQRFSYSLDQYAMSIDFLKSGSRSTQYKFGVSSIFYDLSPGIISPVGEQSLVIQEHIQAERGLESALYLNYSKDYSSRFSASIGLRLPLFMSLGDKTEYLYAEGQTLSVENIVDTNFYQGLWDVSQSYIGAEARISGRYKLKNDLSLKFSFDRLYQFIHVLSNNVTITPLDAWRLSSRYIEPQITNQFASGVYALWPDLGLELSIEGYYKILEYIIDYKGGADLRYNEIIETEIVPATGKTYGAELLIKKNSGDLTGWLSYTYARSFLQTRSSNPEEQVNQNRQYRSNFDRPHSLSMLLNYRLNNKMDLSLNSVFTTGRPTTIPLSQYRLYNLPTLAYSERNAFRIPNYFRIDLSLNLEGNHRIDKKIHGSWSFSVYNLTSRHNASSIFFQNDQGTINAYRFSVFKYAVPTITYNFRFSR